MSPQIQVKMDVSKLHEWLLAIHMQKALEAEDFELCAQIQAEVDSRIENGTINHELMEGFKYFNPATQQYEGDPKYMATNGLFDNYKNAAQ